MATPTSSLDYSAFQKVEPKLDYSAFQKVEPKAEPQTYDPLQSYAENKIKGVNTIDSDFQEYKRQKLEEENRTLGDKAQFALQTAGQVLSSPVQSAKKAGSAVFDAITRLPAQALIAGAQATGLAPEVAGGLTAKERLGSTVAGAETAFDTQFDQLRRGGRWIGDVVTGTNFSELPEEEQRNRFYKDAEGRYTAELSKRGQGPATQFTGLPSNKEETEAQSGSVFVGPLNTLPLVAGRAANLAKPMAVSMAKSKAAAPVLNVLQKGKEAVGSTLETVGDISAKIGEKGVKLATNPYIAGGATLLTTGNPYAAMGAAVGGHFIGGTASKAAGGIGRALLKSGQALQGKGQQELFKMPSQKGPGVFNRMGQGVKAVVGSKEGTGAIAGLGYGLPFMQEAQTPEEAADMVWNFGLFGALGGMSTRNPLQAERLRAAKPFIDRAPKRYGTRYDVGEEKLSLDDIHDRMVSGLPEDKQKAIQAQRGLFDGAEIYVVDPTTASKLGLGNTEGFHMDMTDNKGATKPVILVRQDLMALGHEQGHALLNMLPKELSDYLRNQAQQVYGPEAVEATNNYYKKALALSFPKDGINFTEADFVGDQLKPDLPIEKHAKFEEITQNSNPIDEIIAENLGAIQRADQLPIGELTLGEKASNWISQLGKDDVTYTKLGIAASPIIQNSIRLLYDNIKNGQIELKAPIQEAPAPKLQPPPIPDLSKVKMPRNVLRIDPNAKVKEPGVSPTPLSPETTGTVDLSSLKMQPKTAEPIADYSDAISAAKKLKISHKQIKQGVEAAITAGVTSSEEALRIILNPSKTPIESVSPPRLKLVPTTPESTPTAEPGANIRVKKEDVTPFEKKKAEEVVKTAEKLEEGLPLGSELPEGYRGLRIRSSRVLPGDVTQAGEPKKTRQAVVGDRLFSDPENPTPKEVDIFEKAVETPEKQANLKAFEDLIENQNNADIVYSSAERFKEGEIPTNKERGEEFESEGTGQTGRQVVQKNVQPTNIKVIQNKEGGYSVFLEGHSPDKAIANSRLIFDNNPGVKLPLNTVPEVAKWLNKYYENQNHNYRGDGKPLVDKDGNNLVEPDPDFTPHEIPDDIVQFLNLIQGGEGNNYADVALINGRKLISMEPNAAVRKANEMMDKAKTDKGRKTAQALMVKGLSAGEIPVVDINPLRRQLNEAGFQVRDSKGTAEILSPTFETLRLDRVQKVQDTGKLELKPGKSIFQKAGFMPGIKDLKLKNTPEDLTKIFYSGLEKTVDEKMPNKASREQILNLIKGTKAEELKWSGIEEKLVEKDSWTKSEVLEYLKNEGALKFEERIFETTKMYPGAETLYDTPKFAQYQVPGGENYREVVLSLPSNKKAAFKKWQEHDDAEGPVKLPPTDYTSSHFPDTPNYIAHMRLNDRVDANGRPGLFIEEIQSDRHQQGREKGYLEPQEKQFFIESPYEASKGPYKTEQEARAAIPKNDGNWTISQKGMDGITPDSKQIGKTPDAPFRKDWPLQMFKRALRDAIDSGKEWVGWTSGDIQADRYDLSKQVDNVKVTLNPEGDYAVFATPKGERSEKSIAENVDETELANYIGKDLAQKVISQIESKQPKPGQYPTMNFGGENLRVGGEGMKGFYDKILPSEIGKYVKKFGAKVEKVNFNKNTDVFPNPETYVADQVPIWRVDITPEMKASIKEKGQPMFMPKSEPKNLNQIPVNKPLQVPLLPSQDNKELRKVRLK